MMGHELNLIQKTTLILVCKKPTLRQGKQRLAADIGTEEALTVAQHLLACALEDLSEWPGQKVIAPSHESDCVWASQLLEDEHALIVPQGSGNLGARLNHIDNELRRQGKENLIYIGSDSPTLSFRHLSDAAQRLKTYDTVFSKASDGGVTIMANRTHWPDLSNLPWSTESLEASLAKLCRQSCLSVGYALSGQDVDHSEDLLGVFPELNSDNRPARRALAKHIRTVFKQGDTPHA